MNALKLTLLALLSASLLLAGGNEIFGTLKVQQNAAVEQCFAKPFSELTTSDAEILRKYILRLPEPAADKLQSVLFKELQMPLDVKVIGPSSLKKVFCLCCDGHPAGRQCAFGDVPNSRCRSDFDRQ